MVALCINEVIPDMKELIDRVEHKTLRYEDLFSFLIHVPMNLEEAYINAFGDVTAPAWDHMEKNFNLSPKPSSIYHPSNKQKK